MYKYISICLIPICIYIARSLSLTLLTNWEHQYGVVALEYIYIYNIYIYSGCVGKGLVL